MCGWRWCVLERKYQTTGNDWTGTIHLYEYGTSSIRPLGREIMGSDKSTELDKLRLALHFHLRLVFNNPVILMRSLHAISLVDTKVTSTIY